MGFVVRAVVGVQTQPLFYLGTTFDGKVRKGLLEEVMVLGRPED